MGQDRATAAFSATAFLPAFTLPASCRWMMETPRMTCLTPVACLPPPPHTTWTSVVGDGDVPRTPSLQPFSCLTLPPAPTTLPFAAVLCCLPSPNSHRISVFMPASCCVCTFFFPYLCAFFPPHARTPRSCTCLYHAAFRRTGRPATCALTCCAGSLLGLLIPPSFFIQAIVQFILFW